MRNGVNEIVVGDVLADSPVEIQMKLDTAEFVLVGPDRTGSFWTLLFDTSFKRGDWLRPITGWRSTTSETNEWKRSKGA